jgi:hypothetical protein
MNTSKKVRRHMSVCLSVCLSVSLSLRLSVCLSVGQTRLTRCRIHTQLGLDFIEIGTFKSTSARGDKLWSTSPSIAGSPARGVLATHTTTSVRVQAQQRRQHMNDTAAHAIELAKTNVNMAMDFILKDRPNEFLARSTWSVVSRTFACSLDTFGSLFCS